MMKTSNRVDKETKKEFDNLARMIKVGFDETAKKADMNSGFEQVDKRFEKVEGRLDHVEGRLDHIDVRLEHIDARLSYIERDIEEIRRHFVYRDEFEDLATRVKYLEQKMGVESGK
jgi:tetrahydromethanopterin S-methyltransferase subunit G